MSHVVSSCLLFTRLVSGRRSGHRTVSCAHQIREPDGGWHPLSQSLGGVGFLQGREVNSAQQVSKSVLNTVAFVLVFNVQRLDVPRGAREVPLARDRVTDRLVDDMLGEPALGSIHTPTKKLEGAMIALWD